MQTGLRLPDHEQALFRRFGIIVQHQRAPIQVDHQAGAALQETVEQPQGALVPGIQQPFPRRDGFLQQGRIIDSCTIQICFSSIPSCTLVPFVVNVFLVSYIDTGSGSGCHLSCQPAFINPQEDHPAQDHQAAAHLHPGEPFAQQEIRDDGGESRFQGDDQVGHTGRQQGQADVVHPVTGQRRSHCQQQQKAPAGPSCSPATGNPPCG